MAPCSMKHRIPPAVLLFVCCLLVANGCAEEAVKTPPQPLKSQRVVIAGKEFDLELALDRDARHQGLSDRKSIADNGGMLFVFPGAQPMEFVMRRCLTPIDVIFLSPGSRVVAMHAMTVEPYDTPEDALKRYGTKWPAQFVIELQGGMIEKLGIKEADAIDLPADQLKRLAK